MFGSRLVERRCTQCGESRLLTVRQAKLSRRVVGRSHAPGSIAAPAPFTRDSAMVLEATAASAAADRAAMLSIHHALRLCPACQSEDFKDRRVTRAKPASPGASRNALP
jgi:hypothetical protein